MNATQNLKSEIGVVEKINYVDLSMPALDNGQQTKQVVTVKVLSGTFKGQTTEIDNMLTNNPMFDINLKKGDKVVLHAEQQSDGVEFFIADRERTPALCFLGLFFVILLLLVGKKKGLFSLISIITTIALVFFVLSPMVLSGINPIFSAVCTCVLSSIIAIFLVGGFNFKSTSAVLGTVISLSIAGLMSVLVIGTANLTGFSSEESLFLYSAHPELNFVGVLASAMIIGALGAVMDIAMSIASTVNEIFETNKELSMRELFSSGMNVGRDIIGTMANTLILVYLGGALPLVLLSQNIDLQKFFNLNQVATEISAALVGSIALVVCVPITAILSAYLIKFEKNKDDVIIEL